MQSFLGSMSYYSKFIEDFAMYASVLYELRDTEFVKIRQVKTGNTTITKKIKENRGPTIDEGKERDPNEITCGRRL